MPVCPAFCLRIAALCCLAASNVLAQSPTTAGVQWHNDLDAARNKAQKEGKLLLVHFWTESCGPCRLLDTRVFNQPSVATAIHASYVPVKLNASEFPATAQRFGITRVPTDVVITPGGEVIEKTVCPATPMAYVARVSGIAEVHKRSAGRAFATVAGRKKGALLPSNAAYAGLAVPAESTPVSQPGVTANPYTVASPPAVTAKSDRYAALPATPADRSTSLPVASNSVSNPYASATPPPVTPEVPVLPAVPTAVADSMAMAESVVQLPAGSPPLGFQGYCPVTMKGKWEWKKGDVRWGAVHRGRTYLFVGAAQRDAFLATPDKYSPALSGIDPVLAIDQNKIESGFRKFAVEYRDQFYMFSSEETLRQFWTNADKYANGVRQAMDSSSQRTLR